MATLSYKTAGESHGPALISIIEGMPAGVPVDLDFINAELKRRQGGYGRGGRQKIETDVIEILSGVRHGKTMGSPVALHVKNRDSRLDDAPAVHRPRPGHADLSGSLKWLTTDCRETLERASARETAARVACGAFARCMLDAFHIQTFAFVQSIGPVEAGDIDFVHVDRVRELRDESEVYCPDMKASDDMKALIRQAKIDGDTLGGLIECRVFNCPPGLGSCMQWDQKLDARIAQAVMSIQAFKAVEIGMGMNVAHTPGSKVHDEIGYDPRQASRHTLGFTRGTNNAGGLEGGMTNGQPIVIRAAKKPISTLLQPLESVDLTNMQVSKAAYERSDVCAVPAASVIVENVIGFEIARAVVEKFGGDSMREMIANYNHYMEMAQRLPMDEHNTPHTPA